MVSSYQVKLELDRPPEDRQYTNNDTISGVVTLTVRKSLSLNHIQVKLEGVSTTRMMIPFETYSRSSRDRRGGSKERMVTDEHKVLYETLTVFPPESVRKVSQAKEFTITPGTYTYPFQFQIPFNSSCYKHDRGTANQVFNVSHFTHSFNVASFGDIFNPAQNNGLQAYHLNSQLPPSLATTAGFASISYYMKVTCKRSSFLKTNLRATDPFKFLPFDVEYPPTDASEYIFHRRTIVLKGRGARGGNEGSASQRISNSNRSSFLRRMFDSTSGSLSNSKGDSAAPALDVKFAFEARFTNPANMTPGEPPPFKLFLVTFSDPSIYASGEKEGNGLGVVYLQDLKVALDVATYGSVLATSGGRREIHRSGTAEDILLCNNSYDNLKFDLKDCQKMKSSDGYELEIPSTHFSNCVARRGLVPSFETCNIARRYQLIITAGFSSEPLADPNSRWEGYRKVKEVELVSHVRLLGGLSTTSNRNGTIGVSAPTDMNYDAKIPYDEPPPPMLPQRPPDDNGDSNGIYKDSSNGGSESETHQSPAYNDNGAQDPSDLPTYEEVLGGTSQQSRGRNDARH